MSKKSPSRLPSQTKNGEREWNGQNGNGNGQKRERERATTATRTAITVTGTVRSYSVPNKNGNWPTTGRNGPRNGRNGNRNGHGTGTGTGPVPVPIPWGSRAFPSLAVAPLSSHGPPWRRWRPRRISWEPHEACRKAQASSSDPNMLSESDFGSQRRSSLLPFIRRFGREGPDGCACCAT